MPMVDGNGTIAGIDRIAADRGSPAFFILAFVAATAVAKLVALAVTGLAPDEAYTVVATRELALSYFDHPPLHQWILRAFVWLFGESRWDRLPFWAMIVALNWPLYSLTQTLFDRCAALWSIFAYNATAYLLVLPDGFILPDVPLHLCLAAAVAAIAKILFAPPGSARNSLALWIVAGLALGLAGLSKYSAMFVPVGLLGFLIFSPVHRHWLANWRPYVAAVVAVVMLAPVLVWNSEHDWISFLFQSNRAAGAGSFSFSAVVIGILIQIASLTPWIAYPMVAGMIAAFRGHGAASPERFLLWLSVPALCLFAFMPLLGARAIPHWFNSAWLFVFPLAGSWLSARSHRWLVSWSYFSAVMAFLVVTIYVIEVVLRPIPLPVSNRADLRLDPDWPDLRFTEAWHLAGPREPDFVLVDNWRVGGKLGFALGPQMPLCASGPDPRGLAFLCDTADWIGKDAIFVAQTGTSGPGSEITSHFKKVFPPRTVMIKTQGRDVRQVSLWYAQELLRPLARPKWVKADELQRGGNRSAQ